MGPMLELTIEVIEESMEEMVDLITGVGKAGVASNGMDNRTRSEEVEDLTKDILELVGNKTTSGGTTDSSQEVEVGVKLAMVAMETLCLTL